MIRPERSPLLASGFRKHIPHLLYLELTSTTCVTQYNHRDLLVDTSMFRHMVVETDSEGIRTFNRLRAFPYRVGDFMELRSTSGLTDDERYFFEEQDLVMLINSSGPSRIARR